MRMVLLALFAMASLAPPPAEAARRDERATQSTSRSTAANPPTRASTAATPARATPARTTNQRQTALRPGDVRSQRQGIAVRGAAAAGIPRGAAVIVPRGSAVNGRTAARDQANCTRRNGRTQCTTPRERPLAWQAGLPPMSNLQRECPGGTFAALARGHDNVVRCMPL